MIWMVVAEVLPDAFKEASPSHVASAATISVASMEALGAMFKNFGLNYTSEGASGFLVSLLFGLGPLLGGNVLVAFALAFHLHHAALTGIASGIALLLTTWRPLQLLLTSKLNFLTLTFLITAGSTFSHITTTAAAKLATQKKTSATTLPDSTAFTISPTALQSVLSCLTVALHALAEGLALGVAAPKAYGFGRHMLLPVCLHGLTRGAAVASCIFGATDSWYGSLAGSGLIGIVGPVSAIGAIISGIDYSGLDHLMVFACGGLIPCFLSMFKRAVRLDRRKSMAGVVAGGGFAIVCLMSTKFVCLHTPYCNSAPEAVR